MWLHVSVDELQDVCYFVLIWLQDNGVMCRMFVAWFRTDYTLQRCAELGGDWIFKHQVKSDASSRLIKLKRIVHSPFSETCYKLDACVCVVGTLKIHWQWGNRNVQLQSVSKLEHLPTGDVYSMLHRGYRTPLTEKKKHNWMYYSAIIFVL